MAGGAKGESVSDAEREEGLGRLNWTDLHSDLQLVRELATQVEEHGPRSRGEENVAPLDPELQ